VLTVAAGPALDYATAAAQALHKPADYLGAVLPASEGVP
jgi:multicomponent K+:H+ antiporter subunit D